MLWIIQNNLYNEKGFHTLINSLAKHKLPYEIVKVVPFSHELIPDVNTTMNAIAIGAYTMSEIAKDKGWYPGVFINENFRYEKWKKHYGNHILNPDAKVCTFEHAVNYAKDICEFSTEGEKEYFIRPCEDSKHFAGMISSPKKFFEWGKKVMELGEESTIKKDLMILISPIKKIYREYRFFVVDKKVITGSLYKIGTRVFSEECTEEPVIEFAQKMVDIWCPDVSFVLDIADTPGGYKVVEINSMNASGFYACDMDKVVVALEEYYKQ